MKRRSASLLAAALAGALTFWAAPAIGAGKDAKKLDSLRREAESLYAQGRYPEALRLLEQLDEAGAATGPLLYRLSFCQRTAGDTAGSAASEARALQALESEIVSTRELEVPFYLINTYQNLGRADDARRVAAETTARVDQGEIAKPAEGTGMFQLGKLYADQNLAPQATEWYGRAVESLTESGGAGGPYVRWASRYLAENAYQRKDFTSAQQYYSTLVEAGEGTAQDLDRLAVSRARVGMFAKAAEAWGLVEALNPPDPNRARYCARLCALATKMKSLSPVAPSGKPWPQLTREELESTMKEQAERVRAIFAEGEQETEIDSAKREQYRARLKEVKAIFVPAALEFALRGHDLRQTAFFGGYARLILNRWAWKPPQEKTAESE
jgi:tetratricopeptide (TPR) repeat protein